MKQPDNLTEAEQILWRVLLHFRGELAGPQDVAAEAAKYFEVEMPHSRFYYDKTRNQPLRRK